VPSKFKIKVARIEAAAGSGRSASRFRSSAVPVHFQVPIRLSISDYDATEMVRAARSTLHRAFVELRGPKPGLEAFGERYAAAVAMSLRPRRGTSGQARMARAPRAPTSPVKSAKYRRRAPVLRRSYGYCASHNIVICKIDQKGYPS
jgi:hypothetical protein